MLGDLAAMEVGSKSTDPRTVEQIFKDFKDRRIGILKALTSDVEDFFFPQCDPEKENLCLYGSDASWEVSLPSKEFPPELPEPARGINFSRDRMPREDWLSLIAVHSDAWLVAVAYFYGSRLDIDDRKQLLLLINELPTVFEVVTGKEPVEKFQQAAHPRKRKRKPFPVPKEEKQSDTFCGLCGGNYTADEFWRNCDSCEKWYHGKCVEITPAMNEYIKHYKCPSCCL